MGLVIAFTLWGSENKVSIHTHTHTHTHSKGHTLVDDDDDVQKKLQKKT